MLGTVARKLRIFGFDTLYVTHIDDSEILRMGIEQDRTILTADKEFFKRIVKARAKGVLVGGSDELQDVVHVFQKTGVKGVDVRGIDARCSMCNGKLGKAGDSDVASLPRRIISHHAEFFKCSICSQVYWEGSHIKRVRVFAKSVNSKLNG